MAKTNVKSTATKASDALNAARSNPYVHRIIEDEVVRGNLVDAFGSVREAYRRMSNGRGPATKAITKDKRVQRNLREAAESLKAASEQLRSPAKSKRSGGLGRLLILGIISGGIVLVVSSDARKAVLDMILGKEEEFEYTSTTNGTPSS